MTPILPAAPRTSPLDYLILVLMADNGIQATSPAGRVAASRRFATLTIQAFRVSPAERGSPPPPGQQG